GAGVPPAAPPGSEADPTGFHLEGAHHASQNDACLLNRPGNAQPWGGPPRSAGNEGEEWVIYQEACKPATKPLRGIRETSYRGTLTRSKLMTIFTTIINNPRNCMFI